MDPALRAGMIRQCIICGANFKCSPSDKKVTCSPQCRSERAKRRTGWKASEAAKKKMSEKAIGRDMASIQAIGTEAAKKSPKSGRFESNVNAVDWHLVSPEGKHFFFHSLNFWLRENCRELFGVEPDSREFENVRSGLTGAKRAAQGKKYPCCTYKGWQSIPLSGEKRRNKNDD